MKKLSYAHISEVQGINSNEVASFIMEMGLNSYLMNEFSGKKFDCITFDAVLGYFDSISEPENDEEDFDYYEAFSTLLDVMRVEDLDFLVL